MPENFQRLNSTEIYRGRVFNLRQEQMRLPDGHEAVYDLIDHPGSVSLVPVDEQGRIWFVRQYRVGADRSLLELPAGVLEAGETPEEGARREIREEIGMAAGELRKLGEFYLAAGYSSEFMSVYLATGLRPGALAHDADEFLEVEAIPVERAYALAESGSIPDSKTLASLLLARPHIAQHLAKAGE